MYEFGKVVLVPFPFTDLSSSKLRPGLILSKSSKESSDIILAFITSQRIDNESCFFVSRENPSFKYTGLKTDSFIRFDKIATLSKNIILGEIGELDQKTLASAQKNFEKSFGFFQ